MDQLLILAVAGVGVWALRASAIVFAGGRTPSETTMRTLAYARHAVLAALVASAVAGGQGMGGLVAPTPQLAAAIVAGAVAWRTGGLLRTLAAGVAVVAVLSAV